MHKILIYSVGVAIGLLLLWFLKPEYQVLSPFTVSEAIVPIEKVVETEKADLSLSELVEKSGNPRVAMLVVGVFGEHAEDMIPIFMAESGMREDAMNWNCEYWENGKVVSRACEPDDRHLAWSVDCGVAQINFAGKECPKEAFDPIWNIYRAKEKFDSQGKGAWVAHNLGLDLKFK